MRLPLTFELGDTTTQDLEVHWSDLSQFDFQIIEQTQQIDGSGGNQVRLPDLAAAAAGFDAADGVFALVAGLEGLFNLLEGHLGNEILGVPVPLIGEGLASVSEFIGDLRTELTGPINQQGLSQEVARELFFDAIGPAGLNWLQDLDLDGAITRLDVGCFSCPDPEPNLGGPEGEAGNEIFYRMKLGGTKNVANPELDLDVGIPALGLDVAGDFSLDVGWQVDIGFGIHPTDGVFIEFFGDDEINLAFKAQVNTLEAGAKLGPVSLSASLLGADDVPQELRDSTRLIADNEQTEAVNALRGRFGIDLGNRRYGLTEFGSFNFNDVVIDASLSGSLNLDVTTSVGTDARIPTVNADVHVVWAKAEGSLSEVISSLAAPVVEIRDAALDMGSFVSDVIGPTLEKVNELIDPIRPILDALTTPIPVISDLAGETTFVDLMRLFGSGGDTVANFVESAAQLADLINIPVVNGDIQFPLGSYRIDFGAGGGAGEGEQACEASVGSISLCTITDGADLDTFLQSLPENDETRSYFEGIPRGDDDTTSSSVGEGTFSLPIFQQPTKAIGLLLGQDVTLLHYDVPRLEASFGYSQYFPIFPIFGITVGGQLSIAADFAFGYDTAGIRQFAETNRVQDLFNGFFLDDRIDPDTGEDLPEVEFEAALLAGGELNLLLASGG